MKVCSKCGKLVKKEDLKAIGVQPSFGMANYDLELYNCDCGTTLSFKVYHEPQTTMDTIKAVADILNDIIKTNERSRG